MKNAIQDYAWGSADAIPRLLGYGNPERKPQAELWMGSHRRGPSLLVDGEREFPLSRYIEEDRDNILGGEVASEFGDLPFLFKVLAAGSPLSIQVHPDKKQAEEGFRRENEQSVPLNGFNRNYKDDNHKPEIICAITEFWALRGFRTIDAIISRFDALDLPLLRDDLSVFSADRTSDGLRSFFRFLLSLEGDKKKSFIDQLTEAVAEKEGDEYRWVEKLHEKYPDDAASAAPLYLNLVKLKPGQALYLAAGELHAYLDGLGMELMASSDNVLRGGLTPKYIDRDELERILNFNGADPQILEPEEDDRGLRLYETPCREFELTRIALTEGRTYRPSDKGRVQILFILEGKTRIFSDGGESITAVQGESVFIPALCEGWTVEGEAVIFRASVPGQEQA